MSDAKPDQTERDEEPMADDETFQRELLDEHEKTYNSFIKNSVRGTAAVIVIVALVVFFAIV
jgi:hypothetical protein